MKSSGFNRLFYLYFSLFIFLSACGGPRQYTQADLQKLDTKEVYGTVIKQARGYFILKHDSGNEELYRTGRVTQYIPPNYIPQEGDKVRAAIQEIWKNPDRQVVDKRVVFQVEPLQVAEKNKPIPNPIKGRIKGFEPDAGGYSRSLLLDISEEKPLVMHLSAWETKVEVYGRTTTAKNINWKASIDKDVEVIARREAVRRTNGYIYLAEKINFLNAVEPAE